MMKFKINILSLILFCLIISAAQAQVTVDVSKITCEQFRGYTITDPNNIALWLSGYYNGQRGNTIVNVQSFKEHLEKVKVSLPKTRFERTGEPFLLPLPCYLPYAVQRL